MLPVLFKADRGTIAGSPSVSRGSKYRVGYNEILFPYLPRYLYATYPVQYLDREMQ